MSFAVWLASFAIVLSASSASAQSPMDARRLVERAIQAMGGEALKSLQSLEIEATGHVYAIDQSERPEGPFIVTYEQTKETRDYGARRRRLESQQRDIQSSDWTPAVPLVFSGDTVAMVRNDRAVPGQRAQAETARRALELSPERMLFTALQAGALTLERDVKARGMLQHVVSFPWRQARVRLLLNPHNALPTALEIVGPDPVFSMWGEVTEATYFSYWNLEPGGIRYPRQLDVFWNGVTKSSMSVVKLRIDPPVDDALFAIPDDVRAAFVSAKPSGFETATINPAQAHEIAPGIVQLPGSWNTVLVRQPDGVLVIEAPIGSSYSAQVLEEAARRFPGVPVKGVITTSDAWPHLGGVREYAARGIPIYALDLNRPILERLLAASYGNKPDLLARAPKGAKFTWVSARTTVGTGDTRVDLYPIRGENGERMMMGYFPAHKLLYSSDEIMHMRNGQFFMPQYLLEARDAVQREALAVERVFGMHLPVTAWSEIDAEISRASAR